MPIRRDGTLRQLALLGISILCVNLCVSISSAQEFFSGLVQVAEQPTISFASESPSSRLRFASQPDNQDPDGPQRSLANGDTDEGSNERDDRNDVSADSREQDSEDSLAPMQNRDLSSKVHVVNLSAGRIGTGLLPESTSPRHSDEPVMLPGGVTRGAAFKCVHWRASEICHDPLYFEDTMLERHGQVRFGHVQPLVSGVKFFSTIPMLPYLKTLQPTYDARYTLGHFRPGSCAPQLRDHLPWDKHAAAVEALSAAGFFWAMPL